MRLSNPPCGSAPIYSSRSADVHPWYWGVPVVKNGDWLAQRDNQLVYRKRMWDYAPLIRVPVGGMGALGWTQVTQSGNSRRIRASTSEKQIMQNCGCTYGSRVAGSTDVYWYCPTSCPTTSSSSGMSCSQVVAGGTSYWRTVQTALCALGYDPGVIDGRVGTNTRGAIRRYQASAGLPQTGRIDSATASRLGTTVEPRQTGGGSGTPGEDDEENGNGEEGSSLSRFFRINNPLLWLSIAGIILLGGGATYAVYDYKNLTKPKKVKKGKKS